MPFIYYFILLDIQVKRVIDVVNEDKKGVGWQNRMQRICLGDAFDGSNKE